MKRSCKTSKKKLDEEEDKIEEKEVHNKKKGKDDQLYDIEKDNDQYWKDHDFEVFTEDFEKGKPEKANDEIKIATYNVASWNAAMKKGLNEFIKEENPDILCVQETKLQDGVNPMIDGYHCYFSASTAKKGYAGTAILSKEEPLSITKKINGKENEHGRIITVEYEKFYLVNSYVMNSGQRLENLVKRTTEWDKDMREHLKELQKKKNVIWCGDLNVALRWIDVAKPMTRLRCAGFTKEERASTSETLKELNLVDTFQVKYPKKRDFYTFFSYKDKSKTAGWRLDYFFVSKDLVDSVTQIYRRKEISASDHVPLIIHIKK
ncbi:exodeoxyribonuclease III protein [Entamoeba nuttalli P19]|uniref:Exodeoxyribonuclease III protein n=1 Tax=Entamoeba nuttalli (strain P19) TaxID=1076696 RepID=K2GZU5_ENTNP|nr:exodeoxyribonuclease III protein [Entamoeba nuttalli P19]EKE39497.1 exodeoxyribonuclease III protein [Entamoeba nuttalli P19]|eukprot:XP_008858167.1 exodeoxyribonuclease III protein [Entamoeba nuttalli P19]